MRVIVDGRTYEPVVDVDGSPSVGGPQLVEPWWYRLVPSGHCRDAPLPVDTYWYVQRSRAQRTRRARRAIQRAVLETAGSGTV